MALYRNIAGVNNHGQQMGLTVLAPTLLDRSTLFPPITEVLPGTYDLSTRLTDPEFYAAERERMAQALADATAAKYDWLLSHTLAEVTAAGYYVTADNGSVFKWTDPEHTTSTAYLALQDIQNIENARGTAGTLLLHLQQPALAKDTAGYAGGGSATWGSTSTYSDPIPQVQDLPPVQAGPDGVEFEYSGPSTVIPPTTSTPTTTTTTTATAVKSNLAPLVALGGLVAVAIAGESLTGRKTNILFAGGVGALFYLMVKRNK